MHIKKETYKTFATYIKQRIRNAQYLAIKAVNKYAIKLNRDIGRMIVEKQDELGWKKTVVEQLSKDLQEEFPGQSGWTAHNLWRTRKFHLHYRSLENLAPMVQDLSWSNNIAIMEKCKDDLEREFYIRMTRKYGWTKNILINQIEKNYYVQYLTNQTNFEQNLAKKYRNQAILAVKDEYNFDFLTLAEKYSEKKLESALVNNIRQFMIEIEGYFSFMSNRLRLKKLQKILN